ncbi:MAG: hypothetical protein GY725_13895 [bacterium]|nr:hypothetical protein [bacterium]
MRAIPIDVDHSKLRIDHVAYDHRFAEEDINVNLPLDRLAELEKAGEFGSLARNTYVTMGLQPNTEPLLGQLIRKLNIGATVGRPGDIEGQLDTLRRMIALIDDAEAHGSVARDV